MNNAVLVILIVVAVILVLIFHEVVAYIIVSAGVVAIGIISAIGLYYSVITIIQAVQSNDGVLAAIGCIMTLVCGFVFVLCLVAALDWLRQRWR